MIKLLIMNDLVHEGGVEKVMEELVSYLPEANYDITVVSIVKDYENIKKFYPKNIKYFSVEKAFKYSKKRNLFVRVLSLLKRRVYKLLYELKINFGNYDVAIAMKEGQCMQFISKVKAKKKYAWIHVDYNCLHWTKGLFQTTENELECMKAYNNVVCVSDSAKNSIINVVGDSGNLIVKMNPINVEEILEKSKEKIECLEEYQMKKNRMILVSVGGLRNPKGYLRLLECCKRLNEYFDYELWIIGDGNERIKMEEYIKKFNLDNIILWGNQNNPYPFIKRGDWFISSSLGESYGLAVQEALILNVPVMVTTCPAFEECVSASEGILVENTTEGLYNGLHKILSNHDLNKKYKDGILKNRTHENLYTNRLEEIENLWRERE